MTQQTFFDRPTAPVTAPYVPSSATSAAAAVAIAPCTGRLQTMVLDFIRGRGQRGATDGEVAASLGMLSDTTRARRVELRDRGKVVDSGRRRPTASGRSATVWLAIGASWG